MPDSTARGGGNILPTRSAATTASACGLASASRRLYRAPLGPSLKSDGTNVCGSAGSVRSACCLGVSGTSGGGRTRARDHAIWETQYLKSRVRRSWSAFHRAVPCIIASENNTTDPAGISGMTTQEAFSGASWIWRGTLKLLL